MANVSNNTWCCVGSQLDLFSTPPVMVTQEDSHAAEISSVIDNTNSNNPAPLQFVINSPYYLDMASTKLYLKGKVVLSDGSNLTPEVTIAPTNMFLHSLIRNIDVSVGNNQQKIMSNDDLYPYKAALETLLNFGSDAKQSMLQSQIFYKDTAGKMDSTTDNDGFKQRKKVSDGSKEFEVCGSLHVGLFFQEKYLLSRTKLSIIIHRTSPKFYLQGDAAGTELMFKLSEAKLLIRYVDILDSVRHAHELALANATAKYAYNHIEFRRVPLTAFSNQFEALNIFTKRIPKKIVVTFLQNLSINGNYAYNAFNFQHLGIRDLNLTVNGSKKIGFNEMDFGNKIYKLPYMNLFDAMNKTYSNSGTDISFKDFGSGYTIFLFDLSPDACGNTSMHMESSEIGTVSLSGSFRGNLVDNYTCIVYAEFENVLNISRERNAEMVEQWILGKQTVFLKGIFKD